jgi:hypothetical protein
MVPVEAHLFLNHVPVVGLMFGLIFLLVAMRCSSERTSRYECKTPDSGSPYVG